MDPEQQADSERVGYDAVRRELRERGYLEGRIERFLLRDLLQAGTRGASVIRAALKASLLGGPVFGALLAVAAAAANRPLARTIDLGLLWLYFTPLCAVALFVLDLAVARLFGALAGRRGVRATDPARAALLVAAPAAAYVFALWWRRRPMQGVLEDLGFLAGALVTVLLVAWLAGLVSVASIVRRTGQVPRRRRHGLALAVAILVPLGGLLFAGRALTDSSGQAAAKLPAPLNATRMLWIGIDGLEESLLEALASRGESAPWQTLRQGSSVFPLRREEGAEPAEVWTTFMTGVSAEHHGVKAASASRLPGIATALGRSSGKLPLAAALQFLLPLREVPITGTARRYRTLPEMIGLREAVVAVGWWASWPAEGEPDGASHVAYMMTDRVLPKLLEGVPGDRDTSPGSLFDLLRREFAGVQDEIRARFEADFTLSLGDELAGWVWDSYLIDSYSWRTGKRLMADPDVRGAFLYLPGLDILRHRVARGLAQGRTLPWIEGQRALEGYAAWLGEIVESGLSAYPNGYTVLVGDPGRGSGPSGRGFVWIHGAKAEAGCSGPPLSGLDLAPLGLSLVGYPASEEMQGAAPRACGLDGSQAIARISTFGRRGAEEDGAFSDFDPEMVKRLRSLGYLN